VPRIVLRAEIVLMLLIRYTRASLAPLFKICARATDAMNTRNHK
jgi:hypothetical protein